VGQEYTLNAPLSAELGLASLQAARARFDELHQAQYSHSAPGEPVEIVNLRLAAIGQIFARGEAVGHLIDPNAPRTGKPKGSRRVAFDAGVFDCPVYDRENMPIEETIRGPVVIEERVSTTIVHPGDRARLLRQGPILIETEVA
jgi:N-methylhydantoinase A